MIITIGNTTVLAVLVLGVMGCSTIPAPKAEMALSESTIKDAELAGARNYAPLEFRRANEKYAEAVSAMKEKKYVLARQKSDESRIDAELAEAKSFTEKSSVEMQKLRANIELVRNHTNQN